MTSLSCSTRDRFFDISTQPFYSAFHTDQKIRADEHRKAIISCCREQFVNVHDASLIAVTPEARCPCTDTAPRLNRHYKAALCVLELDGLIEIMQLLVVLEDCVLVKKVKKKEEYLLQLDMQRAGFNDGKNLIDI